MAVGTYGTGARPILDGSDLIVNANLTKTAGLTNVYNTGTINFILGGLGAVGWINVFETGGPGDGATGQFLQFVTSQALCDSTPGSYTIAGMSTGAGVPTSAAIYIHSTDSSSPITNGYTYEFSNRSASIYSTGAGATISGIECRKAAGKDGAINLDAGDGSAFTVNDCLVRLCAQHSLFASGGSVVKNSIFINNYFGTTGGNCIVFYENVGAGRSFWSQNNIFQQDQNITGYGGTTAILSHSSSGNNGTVYSQNDWFISKNSGNLGGFFVQDAASLNISGALGSNTNTFISAYTNVTLTNSQVVSNYVFNQLINGQANNLTYALSGNQYATTLGVPIIATHSTTGVALSITGDIYYRNDKTNSADFINGAGSCSLSVNNVTFDAAVQHTQAYDTSGPWTFSGGTTSGTDNSYKAVQVDNFTWNGTYYSSLATWLAAISPQDSAAITTRSGSSANTLPTIPNVS